MCNKKTLKKYAQIELKHILIEIKNQRGEHLRHFIDQYFCYKNGYVTKNCKPAWGKILWNEWVSDQAEKEGGLVVKEHTIPIDVIKHLLLNLGIGTTLKDIADLLDKYVVFATITKEEDTKLNNAKLKNKMPQHWDKKDVLARYKKVGIKVTKYDTNIKRKM
jgi:hypothetical protein